MLNNSSGDNKTYKHVRCRATSITYNELINFCNNYGAIHIDSMQNKIRLRKYLEFELHSLLDIRPDKIWCYAQVRWFSFRCD